MNKEIHYYPLPVEDPTYYVAANFPPPPPSPPPTPPAPLVQQPDFTQAIQIAATEAPQVVTAVPTTSGLRLHIDGDFLAYNAAGNDDTDAGQARLNALGIIDNFRAVSGAATVVVHSTLPGSHKGERYLVAQVKPYQGHRPAGRKPKNWAYLQDFLLNYSGSVFTSKVWSTREADDGIASCVHYDIGQTPGYGVIATKDKDMRMLPGVHINWDSLDLITVPPGAYDVIGSDNKQYGLKWFWLQMLTGDTADNIPGLEYYKKPTGALARIGEKTAAGFLAGTTTSAQAAAVVMGLYEGCYQDTWADRFVEQAALLWMRVAATDPGVDDFLTHAGHSAISAAFPPAITEATNRMKERVTLARAALDALTD